MSIILNWNSVYHSWVCCQDIFICNSAMSNLQDSTSNDECNQNWGCRFLVRQEYIARMWGAWIFPPLCWKYNQNQHKNLKQTFEVISLTGDVQIRLIFEFIKDVNYLSNIHCKCFHMASICLPSAGALLD